MTKIANYDFLLGAPPAYPGLAHHPGSNHPPAYSPNNAFPPSYSSGFGNYHHRPNPNAYGSQFGRTGLGGNTYISNNYYGGSQYRSGFGSPFLTGALFFGMGMHGGGGYGRSWNSENDRRWRSTTKAPYFENKVPGSEDYLPAAAVIGKKKYLNLIIA